MVWNHVEIMFEPAFLKSTVAIRLMTGHIMQMIIAEIASVITIGLSFGVTMRNASAWASLSTMKNSSKSHKEDFVTHSTNIEGNVVANHYIDHKE